MDTRSNRGFTLIELLAVIVIVGILLAVGVPAMMSLMKSGGLSAATSQVAGSLSLARQYAITQRSNARVIFAYSGTKTNSISLSNMCYLAYTVVSSNRAASAWQYLGKWEYLPTGTIFLDAGSGAAGPLDTLGPPGNIPYPTNGSSTTASFAYIEFTPTGAASQNGTLTITEGFVETNGVPNPTSKSGSALANRSDISFDNLVGRIKVTRP